MDARDGAKEINVPKDHGEKGSPVIRRRKKWEKKTLMLARMGQGRGNYINAQTPERANKLAEFFLRYWVPRGRGGKSSEPAIAGKELISIDSDP